MPKFFHCFYDKEKRRFGAVEIECKKAVSLSSIEMSLLAKSIAIKVLDEQITDIDKIFEKNTQLNAKVKFAENQLGEKISISKVWI